MIPGKKAAETNTSRVTTVDDKGRGQENEQELEPVQF